MLNTGFQYAPVLYVRASFRRDPRLRLFQLGDRGPEAADLGPGFPIGRSCHHANRDEFLAHVDARASLDYRCNHRLFLSAVKSAIRAYAEIFSLGPAPHSGIPARESSQFRLRAHTTTHSDRSLHDTHIVSPISIIFISVGERAAGHR
jgi:hypothetical protein